LLKTIVLASLVLFSQHTRAQEYASSDWDVVVIGGGLMGSSTAWQLARNGKQVLLLEKQGEVYTEGSSFGEARISRSLGPPGDIWSYMHNRTVAEAHELVSFLQTHGESAAMTDIYVTSPVNYVRHKERLLSLSYLPDQKDRYQLATTPKEAMDLFGVVIPDDAFMVREYKTYSGTINPSAVIELTHRGIQLSGGEVSYGQRVTNLTRTDDGFELIVAEQRSAKIHKLTSKQVVSAAGPYTGSLLKTVAPEFDQLIMPKRVFLAFFEVTENFWESLSVTQQTQLANLFPAINSTIPTRQAGSFSMIEKFTPVGTPIIKIGGHFQRTDIRNLDTVWQQDLTTEEIAWAENSLLNHLSLLGVGFNSSHLRLDSGYSCVYSLTNSEVPYVTHAASTDGSPDPDLVIVGGLSGVGAKGSLAYGVIAADLLLEKTEADASYLAAREAFGFERMQRDVAELTIGENAAM